uniref:CSON003904 protein n=1 Tax=Culicoides sonorensis TaxID=179676 RepID=A0A336KHZ4_CULSO
MCEKTLNVYKTLIGNLSNMINDETYKDVTFVFMDSEEEIKAHKYMLVSASPVFNSMFSGNFSEDDKVVIDDIKPDVFQVLLNGIYLKPITLTVNLAVDLYYAAEKYDIGDIRDLTLSFMIKNCHAKNVNLLLQTAKLFNLTELEKTCKNYFAQNTYKVLVSYIRSLVDSDTLPELFALENLGIKYEFELYLALQVMSEWILDHSNCLKQIRFLTMNTRTVLLCDMLEAEDKCTIISNIEALKARDTSLLEMPSYISTETRSRLSGSFSEPQRQRFWIALLLRSDYYTSLLPIFHKFFNISKKSKKLIEQSVRVARNGDEVNFATITKLKGIIFKY